MEQAAEIEAGNLNAKDWQDEAKKVVKKTVSILPVLYTIVTCLKKYLDGRVLQKSPIRYDT